MKKGVILSLLSQFLVASCLMPFFFSSVVHADTLSGQDAVGTDVSYTAVDSIQYQGSSSGLLVYWNTGTVHIQYKLKKAVIGVVRLQFDIEYFTRENNQWTTSTVTEIVNAKFNGDTFVYEFNLNSFGPLMYTWMDTDNNNAHTDNPLRGWSTTILSSNVTFYDDLTDLQDVIDILQDIYSDTSNIVGLSTNQLSELQSILHQCQAMGITLTDIDGQLIDANSYLDVISQLKHWAFPVESLSIILSLFTLVDNSYFNIETFSNNYFEYPVFSFNHTGIRLARIFANPSTSYSFVFGLDKNVNTDPRLETYFRLENIQSYTITPYYNYYYGFDFYRVDFVSNNSSTRVYTSFYNTKIDDNMRFIPVYLGPSDNKFISTDFALRWGLSNQLLDDLHLIAQGTQLSNSASDDLADNTQQFESDRDSYISFEDNMIDDMDDSLNQINPNVGISGFGGYFMNSAVWVRTQFDRLTNNNPYGSMVVYGLTFGIALLFLGKVFL